MKDADRAVGTEIEIGFGPTLPTDYDPFSWVNTAKVLCSYWRGKISRAFRVAYWYDAAQFHELLLACGAQPVRSLIAQLDGCSGGKAGEIINSVGLERTACHDVSRSSG